jgi:hypothetical protein
VSCPAGRQPANRNLHITGAFRPTRSTSRPGLNLPSSGRMVAYPVAARLMRSASAVGHNRQNPQTIPLQIISPLAPTIESRCKPLRARDHALSFSSESSRRHRQRSVSGAVLNQKIKEPAFRASMVIKSTTYSKKVPEKVPECAQREKGERKARESRFWSRTVVNPTRKPCYPL